MALFLWALSAVAWPADPVTVAGSDPIPVDEASLTSGEAPAWVAEVWQRLARHYIVANGLQATSAELAEVSAYDEAFDRSDRAQRARKLAELESRLADDGLSGPDRAQAAHFRDVLTRLAAHETARDSGDPEAREDRPPRQAIVEYWKLNVSLHRRYGGEVTRMPFGHFAHGARLAYLREAEANGVVRFAEPRSREIFHEFMGRSGAAVPQGQEDFTPYWRRPIPPSYFAD